MSAPLFHQDRTREQLARLISRTIAHGMRDPRIPPIVTISDIKVSADTRNATVFVSLFTRGEKTQEAIVALNRAAPYIQKSIGPRLHLKHTPRLLFKLDQSVERSLHMTELLKEIQDDLA